MGIARRIRSLATTGVAASALIGALLPHAAAANTGITIENGGCSGGGSFFCFNPEAASSAAGTTVTWTNQSGAPHTATLCDPSNCPGAPKTTGSDSFDVSIGQSNGSTGSFTFTHAGTYFYYCAIHGYAAMHGKITVSGTVQQDNGVAVTFDGWRGVSDASASGGTYRVSSVKNATASLAFSGTGVSWVTRKGPDEGIARVSIDGVSRGAVDLFAKTRSAFTKRFAGLSSGSHHITVAVTGTKNAASSGLGIPVDAFIAGSSTVQDTSVRVTYDSWTGTSSAAASGGTYRSSAMSVSWRSWVAEQIVSNAMKRFAMSPSP